MSEGVTSLFIRPLQICINVASNLHLMSFRGGSYGQEGDIIGCGFSLHRGEIFFTKNGKFLGVAVKSLLKNDMQVMIPCVSIQGAYCIFD